MANSRRKRSEDGPGVNADDRAKRRRPNPASERDAVVTEPKAERKASKNGHPPKDPTASIYSTALAKEDSRTNPTFDTPDESSIVGAILDKAHNDIIQPERSTLMQYKAGSDEVYGTVLPPLFHDMLQRTGMKSEFVFLDLGSGHGNVVLQAALETKCKAVGIEIRSILRKVVARFAKEIKHQVQDQKIQCGQAILLEGSFLD